jgi:hypothetical protein
MNFNRLTCVSFAIVMCTSQASADGKAKDLMVKSLTGRFAVNVVAIITQQDPSESCYDTVKVERSTDGKIRHSFLAPLCMQGSCSVDDGNHSFLYWPDKKRLVKQDSQTRDEDGKRRIPLAIKNYTFRFEGACQVAGHKTNCVLAIPHSGELDVRRYYLEAKTCYPLKLETISPRGETVVKFETKYLEFPKSIDARVFRIQAMGDVERIDRSKPCDITLQRAAEQLGFSPIMPRELPLGFQVQEVQEDTSSDWHAVIFRLTDGLVRATLYQWKCSDGDDSPVSLVEKNSQASHGGIRLVILADLPVEIRERLLSAFVEHAEILGEGHDDWAPSPR